MVCEDRRSKRVIIALIALIIYIFTLLIILRIKLDEVKCNFENMKVEVNKANEINEEVEKECIDVSILK